MTRRTAARGGLLTLVPAVLLSLAGCASTTSGIRYSSAQTEGPQSIHWIDVDPTQARLAVAVANEQVLGKETPNLDGGGSSTMVVNGRVVNSPSDEQGERPSSDAIISRAH